VLYAAAIPFAFVREWIADAICVMVARMCLVPDRRIESRFHDSAWSATTSVVNRSLNMFTINEFLAADLHARDTLSTEAHYEDPRSVRPARPARSPSCLVACAY